MPVEELQKEVDRLRIENYKLMEAYQKTIGELQDKMEVDRVAAQGITCDIDGSRRVVEVARSILNAQADGEGIAIEIIKKNLAEALGLN